MGLNGTTDAKNKVQGTDNALWKGRVYLLNGEVCLLKMYYHNVGSC